MGQVHEGSRQRGLAARRGHVRRDLRRPRGRVHARSSRAGRAASGAGRRHRDGVGWASARVGRRVGGVRGRVLPAGRIGVARVVTRAGRVDRLAGAARGRAGRTAGRAGGAGPRRTRARRAHTRLGARTPATGTCATRTPARPISLPVRPPGHARPARPRRQARSHARARARTHARTHHTPLVRDRRGPVVLVPSVTPAPVAEPSGPSAEVDDD